MIIERRRSRRKKNILQEKRHSEVFAQPGIFFLRGVKFGPIPNGI